MQFDTRFQCLYVHKLQYMNASCFVCLYSYESSLGDEAATLLYRRFHPKSLPIMVLLFRSFPKSNSAAKINFNMGLIDIDNITRNNPETNTVGTFGANPVKTISSTVPNS